MKLDKEQIQKLVLGVLLMFGLLYVYFDLLLGPVNGGRKVATDNLDGLVPQLATANAQVTKTKTMEEHSPEAIRLVKQVEAMIPDGAPVAWFPPKLSDYFKKHRIDKVTARMNNESIDKNYVGYRRVNWGVDLPKVDFISLAAAIAELENQEPLLEIQSLDIEAGREEAQMQHATLNLNILVRQ